MGMPATVVFALPPFDTGQYAGCEFHMASGDATLLVRIDEADPVTIAFRKVRWHRFTAPPNCEAAWIREAYFRLVEVSRSEALDAFVATERSPIKAYRELHHFRIFLDETGCHEVFAEAAQLR
jgi:hypothetical protein